MKQKTVIKKALEPDLPDSVLNIKEVLSRLYFLSFTDSSWRRSVSIFYSSLLMMSILLISELMLQSILCINKFLASKFLSLCLRWKFWQTEKGIPQNCIEESGLCHQTPVFTFNKELAPQNLTQHTPTACPNCHPVFKRSPSSCPSDEYDLIPKACMMNALLFPPPRTWCDNVGPHSWAG